MTLALKFLLFIEAIDHRLLLVISTFYDALDVDCQISPMDLLRLGTLRPMAQPGVYFFGNNRSFRNE